MRLYCLQHVPFEKPGYIKIWAESNAHDLTVIRLFDSEVPPPSDKIDALVILGGPMSVYDEQEYSWLRKEKRLIENCIRQKKKILGVCLGAQLIADVLGAEVAAMPEREIGWFPLFWTEDTRRPSLFNFLPSTQMVLHWHGQMFQMPKGAVKLASSQACSNQGFLIDNHILGLQFHLEMMRDGLSELVGHSQHELTEGPFVQKAEIMLEESYFEENHGTLDKLLARFLNE